MFLKKLYSVTLNTQLASLATKTLNIKGNARGVDRGISLLPACERLQGPCLSLLTRETSKHPRPWRLSSKQPDDWSVQGGGGGAGGRGVLSVVRNVAHEPPTVTSVYLEEHKPSAVTLASSQRRQVTGLSPR